MNKSDRDWVEKVKLSCLQFLNGEIKVLEPTICNLVLLLDGALGRPSPAPPHISEMALKLGGELPEVRDHRLRELVLRLLSAARNAEGKLTFNKNRESGTLANALGLLRDHLPEGFVPDPLPYSTIQHVKTEFFR
jgi:hypothetical protein